MTARITLDQLTHAIAADRIEKFASNGFLIQGAWHKMNGHEKACLLGAMHPDINSTEQCPAALMPKWMAHMTVTLFDKMPKTGIARIGLKYAESMRSWDKLSAKDWEACFHTFLAKVVRQAVDSATPANMGKKYWTSLVTACENVIKLFPSGDIDALRAAANAAAHAAANAADTAANAAAHAAAYTAANAAYTAANAAHAAAHAAHAAYTAANAAHAAGYAAHAADTAAHAAHAAGYAAHAAGYAAHAAYTAAYMKLFDGLIDSINQISAEKLEEGESP